MNTESPTAPAKPKRERTPEQKAKAAAKERERRAAKKGPQTIREAVQEREAAKIPVVIDGETYLVSPMMTPTERENAARLMHEAHLARKNGTADAPTPDVDRVAPTKKERAATKRAATKPPKAAAPAGHVVIRFSGQTLYAIEKVGSFKADAPSAYRAIRAGETKKMGNGTTTVATLKIDDALLVAKHVEKVAKAWDAPGSKPKDRDGNQPVSLHRAVRNIREAVKAAR